MAQEIERKFLVIDDSWRSSVLRSAEYRQGYLAATGKVSVRVRISGEQANLNLKTATLGISRDEFEYPIPRVDAEQLLQLCSGVPILKTRYFVQHAGHEWEVDVFAGANAGLVVAELELTHVNEAFERPAWLGMEVSEDPRYYNVCLAQTPYREWAVKPGPGAS